MCRVSVKFSWNVYGHHCQMDTSFNTADASRFRRLRWSNFGNRTQKLEKRMKSSDVITTGRDARRTEFTLIHWLLELSNGLISLNIMRMSGIPLTKIKYEMYLWLLTFAASLKFLIQSLSLPAIMNVQSCSLSVITDCMDTYVLLQIALHITHTR